MLMMSWIFIKFNNTLIITPKCVSIGNQTLKGSVKVTWISYWPKLLHGTMLLLKKEKGHFVSYKPM